MQTMEVGQTKQRLEQLVEAAGLRQKGAGLSLAWSIFKQFAVEPVKCADDTLSVYIGPDPRGGSEQFVMRFERRFEINDDEKYFDHAEAVSLLFTTESAESLRGRRFSLSTVGFRAFEPFFAVVEGTEEFQAAAVHPWWECAVEGRSSRMA